MIMEVKRSSRTKTAVSVIVPFVLLAVMIGYVFGPGAELIEFWCCDYRRYLLRKLSLLIQK